MPCVSIQLSLALFVPTLTEAANGTRENCTGLLTCFMAGAASGLAGMIEVAAVHGRANESLAAGYGYAGILVAFVARHKGLPIILVATLLGGILASGGILQRQFKLPDATILLFQGLVFLVILLSDSFYGKFNFFKERQG